MSHHIPFEIQEEIMKRLPIKSLIRFKSVSKPWKSLIQSTKFIARHKSGQHLLLVKYDDVRDNKAKYISFVDDDTFPKDKLSYTVPIFVKYFDKPCIIGCSNGLLCVYSKNTNTTVLWNPAITKSVTIKMPDVSVRLPRCEYHTLIGFGVLPKTCDPKLVQTTFKLLRPELGTIYWQFEIFTLSTRACRSINPPRKSVVLLNSLFDINGFIYWQAYHRYGNGRDKCYHVIMSLDMTSEKFTEVNLPNSLPLDSNVNMSITKLMESLVVFEYIYGGKYYDVWMMENGTSNSFKKIFNIEVPDAQISRGFGFRKNGEIIGKRIKYPGADALFVYDLDSKHKNDVGVYGKEFSLYASSYMETLVLNDEVEYNRTYEAPKQALMKKSVWKLISIYIRRFPKGNASRFRGSLTLLPPMKCKLVRSGFYFSQTELCEADRMFIQLRVF